MNQRSRTTVEICLSFPSCFLALNYVTWCWFYWNDQDKYTLKGSHWLTSLVLGGWVTGETMIPERKKWLKQREENLGRITKMAHSTITTSFLFFSTSWHGFHLLFFPYAQSFPIYWHVPHPPTPKIHESHWMNTGTCQLCVTSNLQVKQLVSNRQQKMRYPH